MEKQKIWILTGKENVPHLWRWNFNALLPSAYTLG